MTVPLHGALTSIENLHRPGFVSDADPGAVGAWKPWIEVDGSANFVAFKVRNAADSGWITIASATDLATQAELDAAIAALKDGVSSSFDTLLELAAGLAVKADLSGATFTGAVEVPEEAYGAGWDGSTEAPTKNALYDKIESLGGGAPGAHATSHQNGGTDEINVAGLSGELADPQPPKTHATSHQSGGGDAIKLDDLSAPDDNTDLDVSTTAHGLAPKAPNDANKFLDGTGAYSKPAYWFAVACSDETTACTTGTAKVTFRPPQCTVLAVRASLTTAPTGSTFIFDINESGASILSTKLSIDAGEKTSTTAATPAVISDASIADDAEMTVDFDQVGSTVAGAGAKVYLLIRPT